MNVKLKRMPRIHLLVVEVLVVSLLISAPKTIATSVDADTTTAQWTRLFSQTVPLTWDWNWEWVPQAATQVTLTITGARSSIEQTFTKPSSNYQWTVFSDPSAFIEDVYEVKLTFKDGNGTPLSERSTRLEALNGVFAQASVMVLPTGHSRWRSVNASCVIPCDSQWTSATAKASTASLVWTYANETVRTETLGDSSIGSLAWLPAGGSYGEYRLELFFDQAATASWIAYVNVLPTGSVVVVR